MVITAMLPQSPSLSEVTERHVYHQQHRRPVGGPESYFLPIHNPQFLRSTASEHKVL